MHDDLTRALWRKSSFSGLGNACIEVADLDTGIHAIRDSKNATGPALMVTATEWSAFTSGVRAGEFD